MKSSATVARADSMPAPNFYARARGKQETGS
jgi:hypothetical protein